MANTPAQSFGLDQVNVSFLDTRKTLPLVISPRWDDSLQFICKWLEINRSWVDDQILHYGAVLVRGFEVDSAVDFEKAVLALQPNLCDEYRGTSPRTLREGTQFAFNAADVPTNYPIAQHLEMSFLRSPPRQLYFGCMKASRSAGGETALCDFRKVYQDLSPELREKFATKKIKYTRKHLMVGEKWTYDVGAMLGWPQLFGTEDLDEVEEICLQEQAPKVTWVGKNKDTFLQEWIDEPYQRHPVTNEMVWFNHTNVFHWTTFPAELWFAFRRFNDIRFLVHCILIAIFTCIKYGILGYKMALNSTFGDGTPITFQEMNEVRAAVHKHMIFSRWQKGDILCIDNFSTSHGRQPTYDKGRSVCVAWSQPFDKTSTPLHAAEPATAAVSSTTTNKTEALYNNNKGGKDVPELVESPDSSPDSTLNNQELNDLRESFLSDQFGEELVKAFKKVEDAKTHRRFASTPDLLRRDSDFWKNN